MALFDSLVVFVVSLLVGGLGIHVGATVVAGVDDYRRAVLTALIGALVWAVVGVVVGWLPFVGPLVTLAAYVAVINWRYPGGWVDAAGIALVAWIASLAVLWVLGTVGIGSLRAVGVPGA